MYNSYKSVNMVLNILVVPPTWTSSKRPTDSLSQSISIALLCQQIFLTNAYAARDNKYQFYFGVYSNVYLALKFKAKCGGTGLLLLSLNVYKINKIFYARYITMYNSTLSFVYLNASHYITYIRCGCKFFLTLRHFTLNVHLTHNC